MTDDIRAARLYRKRPVALEATEWFKNGDHPMDACETVIPIEEATGVVGEPFLSEGKVVRFFRRPDVSGEILCHICGSTMRVHGWIDTLEGGHIVCPGDWIIAGVKGEYYPCKPDIFEATYEPAAAQPTVTIEAELLDYIVEVVRNWAPEQQWKSRLLARVRAAREGR